MDVKAPQQGVNLRTRTNSVSAQAAAQPAAALARAAQAGHIKNVVEPAIAEMKARAQRGEIPMAEFQVFEQAARQNPGRIGEGWTADCKDVGAEAAEHFVATIAAAAGVSDEARALNIMSDTLAEKVSTPTKHVTSAEGKQRICDLAKPQTGCRYFGPNVAAQCSGSL
jgi:hypothetical protein